MKSESSANKSTNFGRVVDWIRDNVWILAAVAGVCVFLGFLAPLISAKTVISTFENDSWTFSHGDRTDINCSILFGVGTTIVWPLTIAYSLIVGGIACALFGKRFPRFLTASMILYIVGGIFVLLSSQFYDYANCLSLVGGQAFWDWIKDYSSNSSSRLGVGSILAAVIAFVAGLLSFSAAFEEEKTSVRDMTEIAILSASAIIIDVIFHYFPHIEGQFGSISLATLPLFFIALRHGPTKGFLASGIVFGLITCFTDGYGFFLYPLDYLVGFGSCAVLGFFQPFILNEKVKTYNVKGEIFIFVGVLLAAIVRFVGSTASSIINYGLDLGTALIGNSIYIPISAGLSAIVLMAIYGPLINLNKYFKTRSIKVE
jgi:thiamine transporter ThiT